MSSTPVTPFSFTPVTNATRSTSYFSNTITIAGLTGSATIGISGSIPHDYSKNGGAYTSAGGTVVNGDTITIRLGSASTYSTTASATIGIDGATFSTSFTVTTGVLPDMVPDTFAFTAVTGATPNTVYESNSVTITGINVPTPISITQTGSFPAEYKINGGTYTSTSGTVSSGDVVTVRMRSSTAGTTATTATLTINATAKPFKITTAALDTTPQAFTIPSVTAAAWNSNVDYTFTIQGINTTTPLSTSHISGPSSVQWSANGGAFTTGSGSVQPGDALTIRIATPGTASTASTNSVTIGGVSSTFTVTTAAASLDTTPDAFSFTAVTGANLGVDVTSNTVTISGINTATPVTFTARPFTNDAVIINGTPNTGVGPIAITNGATIAVRLTASSSPSTAVTSSVGVGTVTQSFSVTTGGTLTPPTLNAFTPVTNAVEGQSYTSNTITVSGLSGPATIMKTGSGFYSVNGNLQSGNSFVNNGDTISATIITTGYTVGTYTLIVSIVGVASYPFAVTVVIPDTIPDPFDFVAVTNATVNTAYSSNPVTITGINVPTFLGIAGFGTGTKNGVLITGNTTVVSGDVIQLFVTSSAAFNTANYATVNIGQNPGVVKTYYVTTGVAPDVVADAFSFLPVTNATLSTEYTANFVVSGLGIGVTTQATVAGGAFSINGGPYISTQTGVVNGDNISVRVTSPAVNGSTNIGTVTLQYSPTSTATTGTFSVSSPAASLPDTIPDAFSFTPVASAAINTDYTSNVITVSGINTASPISISSGSYSVNGGAFVTTNAVVNNGDTVAVKLTSSGLVNSATAATLTIGGVSGVFTINTAAPGTDTTPDAFSFAPVVGATLSTTYVTDPIAIHGVNTATPISVIGGKYKINGGASTTASGTINNGDTVQAELVSASGYGALTTATVTIGGVAAAFNVTTSAAVGDTVPDAFSFAPITNAALSTNYTSNAITVAGINAASPISISGTGQYRINSGAYTSAAGTVANGDVVTVLLSSSNYSATTSTTLTIGGVSGTFSVSTPNSFLANATSNGAKSTTYTVKSTQGNVPGNLNIIVDVGRANGPLEAIQSSDLTLYGYGKTNWGQEVDQNFYRLLENFACQELTASPSVPQTKLQLSGNYGINKPVKGQSWWNLTTDRLYICKDPTTNAWTHIISQDFADARYVHAGGVTGAVATYLQLDGSNSPMTGFLTLNANPTALLHAATKGYTDTAISTAISGFGSSYVKTAGDKVIGGLAITGSTITGFANTAQPSVWAYVSGGQPTIELGGATSAASPKIDFRSSGGTGYDSRIIASAGNTSVSGQGTLQLIGNIISDGRTPTLANQFVTKSWVETLVGGINVGGGTTIVNTTSTLYVQKSGDVMTGALTLSGAPTSVNHAVNKGYADGFLPIAGGSVTGNITFTNVAATLTLSKDPTAAMQAATKQYVDAASALTVPESQYYSFVDYVDVATVAYLNTYATVKSISITVPAGRKFAQVSIRSMAHHANAGWSISWIANWSGVQKAWTQTNATSTDNLVLPVSMGFNVTVTGGQTYTLTIQAKTPSTSGSVFLNGGQFTSAATNTAGGISEVYITYF